MKFLIISGLSGAGKSRVAGMLEDLDYYCVDNMPVALMTRFAELCIATRGRYDKVALVVDVRVRESFEELFKALDEMRAMGCEYEILFIEASPATIIKRYKETRRPHPLDAEGGGMEAAVYREKRMLEQIRAQADYIIDTTDYRLSRLQSELFALFGGGEGKARTLSVSVVSFGFKYGIPVDADLVFDVRFLPNPYYVPELTALSGLDKDVKDYVFGYPQTTEFMDRLTGLLGFLFPLYMEEGKQTLVIAIGCTGGHHRSVAVAQAVADFASAQGHRVLCTHRDVDKQV